ncbi:MAG TPA: hypothetical protein VK814_12500 [Acidobacteriaceae bacterium]|nr:hypothetical protein [Acidobacteriaceae bacterium]
MAGEWARLAARELRLRWAGLGWVGLPGMRAKPESWLVEVVRRTGLRKMELPGMWQERMNSMRSETSSCPTKLALTMCFCTRCTRPQNSEAMLA